MARCGRFTCVDAGWLRGLGLQLEARQRRLSRDRSIETALHLPYRRRLASKPLIPHRQKTSVRDIVAADPREACRKLSATGDAAALESKPARPYPRPCQSAALERLCSLHAGAPFAGRSVKPVDCPSAS